MPILYGYLDSCFFWIILSFLVLVLNYFIVLCVYGAEVMTCFANGGSHQYQMDHTKWSNYKQTFIAEIYFLVFRFVCFSVKESNLNIDKWFWLIHNCTEESQVTKSAYNHDYVSLETK